MVRRKAPATGTPSSKAAAREDGTRRPTTRDSTPEQAENDLEPPRSDEEDDGGEPRQRAFDAEDVYDQDLLNMAIPPMPEPVMKSDGSGSRLMITSITVDNFKSYFGRQQIGPFHQNFTAIVGPNGSGKSNVIDALLFVFGYRASKIRSKKISVLIHSSNGRENLQSCSVSVNFQKIVDKGNDFEIVHGSSFVVSRTAYRDNSSKYTYNGKTIHFKELAGKLRQVGIDLIHNRFLILQGEVEQIALMKPKAQAEGEEGMLEYLEDIIGSNRLKQPIERLHDFIEKLQEERSAQLNRVKAAEEEKNGLEGPVKEYLDYMKLENKIAHVQNKIHQLNKHKIAVERDEKLQPKIAKYEGKLERLTKKLDEVLEKQNAKKEQQNKLQRDYDEAQENEAEKKKRWTEMESRDQKLRAQQKRTSERKTKLEADIKAEQKKIKEFKEKPERAQRTVEEFREVIANAEKTIKENTGKKDANIATFEAETGDAKERKRVLEEKLGVLTMAETQASNDLTVAQDELQTIGVDEDRERRRLDEIRQLKEEAELRLTENKEDLKKAQRHLPTVEAELTARRPELEQLKVEEARLTESMHGDRVRIQNQRQAADQTRHMSKMLQRLMEEKQAGRIPGIFGRLGDLGAIDEKYDVAISTCCGALDNVLVDTIETAQECVALLKRENLGTGTFIALNKQQVHIPNMRPIKTMFDLVRVTDETVKPAFYYALRDTLVADNIRDARRIAFESGNKRWRVVSVVGDVVEIAGTMSGGGGRPQQGRMGSQVRVDTTKDTGKEMAAAERKLEQDQKRLEQCRTELHQLTVKVTQLQTDFEKTTDSIKNLSTQITDGEKRLTALDKRFTDQAERLNAVKVDEEARATVRRRVEQCTRLRDAAAATAEEQREKVETVAAEIQAIWDRLIGPFQKAIDAATATKEQSGANAAERNLKKAQTNLHNYEADLEKANEQIATLVIDIEKLTTEGQAVLDEMHDAQQERIDKKRLLEEESKKNAELNDVEIELQREKDERQLELKKLTDALVKMNAQIKEVDKLISKLKLHGDLDGIIRIIGGHSATKEHGDFLDETENDSSILNAARSSTESGRTSPPPNNQSDDEEGAGNSNEAEQLKTYGAAVIATWDSDGLTFQLAQLEQQKTGQKAPNQAIVAEYKRKVDKYERLTAELDAISSKRDKHRTFHDQLKKKRMNEFMDGFTKIGLALKEMYQMITLGGDASLDLVDSLDPFSEGISFGVRPPKKSWKQIANLSGGEKTLSSLALVFALHSYKPTPLYVMDEIDAALDFRNVSIIAHYVKDRTKNAQFIIISLRNNMFELGDRLVGIYKTHDCTHNVVIDPGRICLGVDENERPTDTAHSSQNSAASEENVANVSGQSADANGSQ